MPKGGRKGGHKGRARQYTSPEEIDAQLQAEKQKAKEEEEEQEEGGDGATGEPKKEKKSLESDESEEEEDEDYQPKHKGVEGMIDIENPNRVVQAAKKVTQIDLESPRELSRREREEIEKQKAKERYMKMHLAGKTEQAKADLARLAIIRKQREEAAKKKEEERKAKDEATSAGKRMQSLSLNNAPSRRLTLMSQRPSPPSIPVVQNLEQLPLPPAITDIWLKQKRETEHQLLDREGYGSFPQ
ncbi:hypothetical protein lerEdw1_018458 [Lerista edwardsae]|nr:hypothetical protein lerEdw1_018458 [Lerista edwardsae]